MMTPESTKKMSTPARPASWNSCGNTPWDPVTMNAVLDEWTYTTNRAATNRRFCKDQSIEPVLYENTCMHMNSSSTCQKEFRNCDARLHALNETRQFQFQVALGARPVQKRSGRSKGGHCPTAFTAKATQCVEFGEKSVACSAKTGRDTQGKPIVFCEVIKDIMASTYWMDCQLRRQCMQLP